MRYFVAMYFNSTSASSWEQGLSFLLSMADLELQTVAIIKRDQLEAFDTSLRKKMRQLELFEIEQVESEDSKRIFEVLNQSQYLFNV